MNSNERERKIYIFMKKEQLVAQCVRVGLFVGYRALQTEKKKKKKKQFKPKQREEKERSTLSSKMHSNEGT